MTATDTPTFPRLPIYAQRTRWAVAALAGAALALWWLSTPAPVLDKVDAIGYAVCHRIPARSFFAYGRQLPLCARCTGLYVGVLTGLGTFLVRGRARASRLPPVRLLAVLVLLGTSYAFDGLNSYLSLFDFYTPLYPPLNTLRLLTGTLFGLGMIAVVWPVFNAQAWATPEPTAPIRSAGELGALYALAALVDGAILLQWDAVLRVVGILTAGGVVLMFTLIGAVLFLAVTRRENALHSWRDMLVPALAGIAFAFAVIGGIDFLRYRLTGTWGGFPLG